MRDGGRRKHNDVVNPEQFEGRISFMSMFNDINWTKKGNSSECFSHSEKVKDYGRMCPRGLWSFVSPGEENKWCGTHTYKPEGQWNEIADVMVEKSKESGHPIFRGISALNRGMEDVRFTSLRNFRIQSSQFRTIHSANQLS